MKTIEQLIAEGEIYVAWHETSNMMEGIANHWTGETLDEAIDMLIWSVGECDPNEIFTVNLLELNN